MIYQIRNHPVGSAFKLEALRKGEKTKKRKEKPKVSKQTRLTDYHDLATRSYGTALRDPAIFGTEDGRRMDAGIG